METLFIKDEYRSILVIGLVTCAVYIVMSIRQKSTNSQEKVFFSLVHSKIGSRNPPTLRSGPWISGLDQPKVSLASVACFRQITRIFFTNVRNENCVLCMPSIMSSSIKNLQKVQF